MKLNILLFVILLFSNCSEISPLPDLPPVVQKDTLVIKWKQLLSDDFISRYNSKPLVNNNQIISSKYDLLSTETELIYAFNKLTGEINWMWNDYLFPENGEDVRWCQSFANSIYCCSGEGFYTINWETGLTVNNFHLRTQRDVFGKIYGGYVYDNLAFPIGRFTDPGETRIFTSQIYSLNLDNLSLTPVIKFQVDSFGDPLLGAPEIYKNSEGQILLIGRNWKMQPKSYLISRINFFCYNYTLKKFEWQLDSIENVKHDRTTKTINDRIYYQVATGVYCLNLETGEIIWKHLFENEGFSASDFLIADSKIFLSSNAGNAYALDQNSGRLIWANTKNEETGAGSNGKLILYKNRLYYSDGRIFILDANTGKLLHKYSSPNYSKVFNDPLISDITIDDQTDLMYFADGYFMMCAELPK